MSTSVFFINGNYPGCDDCAVHTGFFKAWLAVQDAVTTAVQKLLLVHGADTQVAVTGHSMG
jgi:Lipase (class 3)